VTVHRLRTGLRPAAIVATVMLLLLLAVGELFSPGGTSQQLGAVSPLAAVVQASCDHDHSDDETQVDTHPHGDDLTSSPAPRLRSAGDTTGVLMPAASTGPARTSVTEPFGATVPLPDADPIRRGVLRV
jgi:hypothetical protein